MARGADRRPRSGRASKIRRRLGAGKRLGSRAEQARGAARAPCVVVTTSLTTQSPPQARLLRPEAPRGVGRRKHLRMPARTTAPEGASYLLGPAFDFAFGPFGGGPPFGFVSALGAVASALPLGGGAASCCRSVPSSRMYSP